MSMKSLVEEIALHLDFGTQLRERLKAKAHAEDERTSAMERRIAAIEERLDANGIPAPQPTMSAERITS